MYPHVVKDLLAVLPLRETIDVELKTWISPLESKEVAKIARACIALRNQNGGTLFIGVNDSSGMPDPNPYSEELDVLFHNDRIQEIVGRYSSDPFQIEVTTPEVSSNKVVCIRVPSGFSTPACAKADLKIDGSSSIKCHTIYVRTINSNHRVSTSELNYKDLPSLIERCFDNREADIARFLKRNFSGSAKEALASFFAVPADTPAPTDPLLQILNDGQKRFQIAAARNQETMPSIGNLEFAAYLEGKPRPYRANQDFLRLIQCFNPRLTGWPFWIDSSGFSKESARPLVIDGGWEAFLAFLGKTEHHRMLDFWRIEPKGVFYHLRGLEDDLVEKARQDSPVFDLALFIYRVDEALRIILRLAGEMDEDFNNSAITFGFRLSGLSGRKLAAWANPRRWLGNFAKATQDTIVQVGKFQINMAKSAIVDAVQSLVVPVGNLFEGLEISHEVLESIDKDLVEKN